MKIYAKDGTKLRDAKYLKWIRGCGCIWGGIGGLPAGPCQGDIVPAHGKPWGRGMKGPDYATLPMCHYHHTQEHNGTLTISETARDKMVLQMNEHYCSHTGITLKDLRGK